MSATDTGAWSEQKQVSFRRLARATDRLRKDLVEISSSKEAEATGFTIQLEEIDSLAGRAEDFSFSSVVEVENLIARLLGGVREAMMAPEVAERPRFVAELSRIIDSFEAAWSEIRVELRLPEEQGGPDRLPLFAVAPASGIKLATVIGLGTGRAKTFSGTLRNWLQMAGFLAHAAKSTRELEGENAGSVTAVTAEHLVLAVFGAPVARGKSPVPVDELVYKDVYDMLQAFGAELLEKGAAGPKIIEAREQLHDYGIGKTLKPEALDQLHPEPVLAEDVLALLNQADQIRERTIPSQQRVDARHFLTALLHEKAGRLAIQKLFGAQTDELWPELVNRTVNQVFGARWRGESESQWMGLFDEIGALGTPRDDRPLAPLPGYRQDKPWLDRRGKLVSDPLGVVVDARAMADLIVLKEPGPPLAIGLFGDWGAGKSTFMEILEKAIDENTERARQARRPDNDLRALPFVENVAHIRFNAWHYAEANLWASLATQIFRELLVHSGGEGVGREQIEKLIGELGVSHEALQQSQEELERARKEAELARHALGDAQSEVAQREADLAKAQQPPDYSDFVGEPELAEDLQALGLSDIAGDVDTLLEVADQGLSLAGGLNYLVQACLNNTRPEAAKGGLLVFGGLVGAAFLLALVLNFAAPAIADAALWIGSTAGVVAGAARWLLPLLKDLNSRLKRIRTVRDQLIAHRQAQLMAASEREKTAKDALASAKGREAKAALAYEEKREAYDRETEIRSGERPGELFLKLIEQRAGEDGYRKHLGLVSQLREDFELMSDLLLKQEVRRHHKLDEGDLPEIERIVLYIDDLDRCPDRTVIQVLEAVHLLLALPLFVVVVGVDARWLTGALGRTYQKQLDAREVRPEDYLEKIFQFPYWLRPMNAAAGGNFDRFMESLLSDEERTLRARKRREDGGEETEEFDDFNEVSQTDTNGAVSYLALKPQPAETVERVREAVEITAEEADIIEALGAIIAKSPRATKRFMNLYRFEKARRMQMGRSFMGETDAVAEFPGVALSLALDIGLGPRTNQAVKALLRHTYANDMLEEVGSSLYQLASVAPELGRIAQFSKLEPYLPEGYFTTAGELNVPREEREEVSAVARAFRALKEGTATDLGRVFQSYNNLVDQNQLPRASFARPS